MGEEEKAAELEAGLWASRWRGWRGGGGGRLATGKISCKACGLGVRSPGGLFPRAAGEKAVRLHTILRASTQLVY